MPYGTLRIAQPLDYIQNVPKQASILQDHSPTKTKPKSGIGPFKPAPNIKTRFLLCKNIKLVTFVFNAFLYETRVRSNF